MKYRGIITCMLAFAGAACAIDDKENNGVRTRSMEKARRDSHNPLVDIENENAKKKQKSEDSAVLKDITNLYHSNDYSIEKKSEKRKKPEASNHKIVTAMSVLTVSRTQEFAQSPVSSTISSPISSPMSSTVFSQLGCWDLCNKGFYMSPDSDSDLTPSDKMFSSCLSSDEESFSGNASDLNSMANINFAKKSSTSYSINAVRQASIPVTPEKIPEKSDASLSSYYADIYENAEAGYEDAIDFVLAHEFN